VEGAPVSVEIVYPSEKYFPSFHDALSIVARERIYIEMTEAPLLEKVSGFQQELISKNGAVYCAIDNEKVVGWCDVFPMSNPRLAHRGGLGMGLIPEYRGRGVGTKLLSSVLDHAKRSGLEKIELYVYTSNTPAIALYRKFGFLEEGIIKHYRKLDGVYFDCLAMGKFL
jgi:ribosomal protein S18 acetylase RimI-like enzyme